MTKRKSRPVAAAGSAGSIVPDLLEDIAYLEQLESLRSRAKELRDAGLRALKDYQELLDDYLAQKDRPDGDPAAWRESNAPMLAIWNDLFPRANSRVLLRRIEHLAWQHGVLDERRPNARLPDVTLVAKPHHTTACTHCGAVPGADAPAVEHEIVEQSYALFSETDAEIPVIFAATYMRAWPDDGVGRLDKSFFLCQYRLIWEIYYVSGPEWFVGAAQAGARGQNVVSTFVTSEVSRAIGHFVQMLRGTGAFLGRCADQIRYLSGIRRDAQSEPLVLPESWWRREEHRVARALATLVETSDGRTLFRTPSVRIPTEADPAVASDAKIRRIIDRAISFVSETWQEILAALREIFEFAADKRLGGLPVGSDLSPKHARRTALLKLKVDDTLRSVLAATQQSADGDAKAPNWPGAAADRDQADAKVAEAVAHLHATRTIVAAFNLIDRSWDELDEIGASESRGDAPPLTPAVLRSTSSRLECVAKLFRTGADRLVARLRPIAGYAESRMYAAAYHYRTSGSTEHVHDLAFAALSSGFIDGSWRASIFSEAVDILSRSLDENGRMPTGRPFHVGDRGSQRIVVNAHVLRAFCQIMENVPGPLDADVVERMLGFFERTKLIAPPTGREPAVAWRRTSLAMAHAKASPWVSALSVQALNRVVRMLERKLNERLACHFRFEKGSELKAPSLDEMMCTDVALASVTHPWRDMVTTSMEQMREHVEGLRRRAEGTWSLILFGPPGTGKTTMLESLAKTCQTDLVRVTPSDFLWDGGELVERRADAVARALGLLTGVVVLFDEFDPVLYDRGEGSARRPSSVLEFLTGNMLPRFSELHAAAKRRRFVYALATNFVNTLDAAAIRAGRFDRKIGVYPPDMGARACRLVDQWWRWCAMPSSGIARSQPAPTSGDDANTAWTDWKARVVSHRKELTLRSRELRAGSQRLDTKEVRTFLVEQAKFWRRARALPPAVLSGRAARIVQATAGVDMPTLTRLGWFIAPRPSAIPPAGTPFRFLIDGIEPEWPLPTSTSARSELVTWLGSSKITPVDSVPTRMNELMIDENLELGLARAWDVALREGAVAWSDLHRIYSETNLAGRLDLESGLPAIPRPVAPARASQTLIALYRGYRDALRDKLAKRSLTGS